MMRSFPLPSRRTRSSCSVLALATVLVVGATPAMAQSFAGTGSIDVNGGGASGIATGSGTTTVTLNPGQSVVNWIPTDNAVGGGNIVFQPNGTTATFTSSDNFAVLNNVNVADFSRIVELNGTINSNIGGQITGGSVYFYSPSGFLLGPSSLINVGSLVLTASPITVSGGSFITGTSVTFGQAPNAGSRITTTAGSQINASAGDAYVAMVAPRVQHSGNINVNGSAALVGAEAATINFSPDGLFDIQVTSGTTDANGVASNGTITGSAGGAGDVHRAYLVAVPKNAALTMAITQGGSLGFDIADAADVVGNTVVLSAGYNVTDGFIESSPAAAGSGFKSNLSVTGANMTSALVAAASGNADIFSPAGQSSNFASNVTMRGVDRATVGASGFTTTVNIAGNLDLSTATTASSAGQSVSSGRIDIYAQQNASVTVNGATSLNSNAYGGGSQTSGVAGGGALAGDINVTAQTGGDVMLSGLTAIANGYGGYGAAPGANGGTGTGGDILVSTVGVGSSITVNGNMVINADGRGGDGTGLECFSCDGDGGIGNGGTFDGRALAGGTLDLLGENISVSTSGFGGDAGNGDGGNAFGGNNNQINADGVGSIVTLSGATTLISNAAGGDSNAAAGGTARGGTVRTFAQNSGALVFDNELSLYADGFGGAGAVSGGDAFGGTVYVASFASLQVDGLFTASAEATGGQVYFTDFSGNVAGDAVGGAVDVFAQNGLLTLVGGVTLSTDAVGGQADNSSDFSGDGTGGITRLFANAGGTVDLQSTLYSTAIGRGGGDSYYYSSSVGGNGRGGDVRVQAAGANASVTVADQAVLNATGEGSSNGGGTGTGGTVWADSFGAATASLNFQSDVELFAQGLGGNSNSGNGGNAQGGQALLQASAGSTVSVGGNAIVDTNAFGGYSYDFSDGSGGDAIGGQSRIQTFGGTGSGGTVDIDGNVLISADGWGGQSYSNDGGLGGNGTGGSAHLITTLGNIIIGVPGEGGSVDVSADGHGGDAEAGTGGNGTGGIFARIEAANGDITIEGYALASTDGEGGDGFNGGDGIGSGDTSALNVEDWTGGAHIYAINGNIVINGGAGVSSSGSGGDGGSTNGYGNDYGSNGGDGGDGAGGWASIHAANGSDGPSSITIVGGDYEASGFAAAVTDGTGGDGGNGYEGEYGNWGGDGISGIIGTDGGNGTSGGAGGAGGRGGNGVGGVSVITAASDNGHLDIALAYASANALGGYGGNGADGGQGGYGGNGGSGSDGAGGNGGNGGNGGVGGLGGAGGTAIGGVANVGTESGTNQAFGDGEGTATYGSITVEANATGGQGGDGGSSGAAGLAGAGGTGTPAGIAGNQGLSGAAGDGGAGGNASGGAAILLVRGSTVTVDLTTLYADATGGNGGSGDGDSSSDGAGGNATIGGDGGIGAIITGRNFLAAQRGTLNAGQISGTATATGGAGSSTGISESLGGNAIFFSNADANIGSISFLVQADQLGAGALPDLVLVRNALVAGDVVIDGELSFVTSGNLSLFLDNGDLVADSITWNAADFVPDLQYGTPTIAAGTFFANTFDITTGNNFLTTANLDSVNPLTIDAPGSIYIGNVTGGSSITLTAQNGEIDIANVLADGEIDFDAWTSIRTGTIGNSGNTSLNAGTSIDVGAIDSGSGHVSLVTGSSYISGSSIDAGSIYADSGSDIFLGNLTATNDIELIAVSDILIGNATSGETIDLEAGGYIDGGTMTAGDSVYAEAGEYVDLLDISAGLFNQSSGYDAEYNVGILAGAWIETGDIAALNSIGLGALGDIYTGSIDAPNIFLALGGGNMSFGAIDAGVTYLADVSMVPLGGNPSDGDFDPLPILAATPVASGGSIELRAAVDTGRFEAAAGTTLTGTTINSGSLLYATSGGNMDLGDLTADNDVLLTSGGDLSTGSIWAGDNVALVATGSISTLDIFAYDDVTAEAGMSISTDDITGNSVDLFADSDITTGTIDADTYIYVSSDTGLLTLANLTAGSQVALETGGSIVFGDGSAADFNFEADGSVTGGNIVAVNHVDGEADGAIVLQDVTVTGPTTNGSLSVGLLSGTSIETGNVSGTVDVSLVTQGNLTTGNLAAGNAVIGLAGGDIVTGSITTPANGRVYFGDYSMFIAAGGDSDGDYDLPAVLALAPVPTGGSITINGAVTTGRFQAAAGDDLATKAITANQIEASAGGNATIDGIWLSPDVLLQSGDIDITANGGIDGGTNGLITLNAVTNESDILIGDGLTGTGYALSNAEFGRLSAGTIRIVSGGNGGDADMLIGDLTITGPLAGSNIESNDGGVEFITLQEDGAALDGTLRVVGDVVATGFGPDNYLGFYTQNFELDAATGLISLTGDAGALAGTLEIYASRIHVAEGSLLDQLADDPQFAGYREALNQQAAVQRPDGVVRAANFDIEFGGSDIVGPYTLFVQNMGTTDVPAGFLLNAANISDDGEELPAGSIDMAINGQIITAGGTLTGIDVRDLLVTEFGTAAFVDGSTINGCVLVGPCGSSPPPPSPPPLKVDTITRTDVQLTDNNALGDGLFGNEADIDDGLAGDENDLSSPIEAPVPLFDTRPLGESGDINDPVSGAGNPSLYDSPAEEDEEEKKRKAKAKKGDGK